MKHVLFVLILCVSVCGVSQAQSISEQLQTLTGRTGNTGDGEFLSPDAAFRLSASVSGDAMVRFTWLVADGYYLYRDKFRIGSTGATPGQWQAPPGKIKRDESFGEVEVNTGVVDIDVPVTGHRDGRVSFQIGYQGCKDNAICYPPVNKTVTVDFGDNSVDTPAKTAIAVATLSVQDQITEKLKGGSILVNMAAFFVFGLLLSLTPCVFPMIPILSGIIVGQSGTLTSRRGFYLSLTYVLAMAMTYAGLGVLAGSLQLNIQSAAQNSWVITAFSLVFVLLSLSMFGFYELQLPAAWQTRLQALSRPGTAAGLPGVALMGAVSAVIVGPCVAPPLAGALLYISQTGNALLGGLALLCMGLGFGVPLLLLGTSAASLLPGAGAWMQTIKYVFGVIMLAVAVWFMERVLPTAVSLVLWGVLFVTCSLYLGSFDTRQLSAWQKTVKTVALLLFIYGTCLIIGALAGATDKFRPLQPFTTTHTTHRSLVFDRVDSLAGLQQELQRARETGNIVMLDFYADWCITCIEMERKTFSTRTVQDRLAAVRLLQADVTANNRADRELLAHFGIYGPPAILFFDEQGVELRHLRLVGFVNEETFLAHLQQLRL